MVAGSRGSSLIAQDRHIARLQARIKDLEAEVERLNREIAGNEVASVARCDRYLQARHCTLWGESFEIISPAGRAEAAKWLAKQIAGVAGIQ